VIKPSAATPKLMKHKGRAVVFESMEDYMLVLMIRLDIDEIIIVLKGVGPKVSRNAGSW
jgi:dihydroxy-acid dehydratase